MRDPRCPSAHPFRRFLSTYIPFESHPFSLVQHSIEERRPGLGRQKTLDTRPWYRVRAFNSSVTYIPLREPFFRFNLAQFPLYFTPTRGERQRLRDPTFLNIYQTILRVHNGEKSFGFTDHGCKNIEQSAVGSRITRTW
jgi:hypothetical protein